MLNDIVLGTSFSPEYAKQKGSDNPLDILKIINKELGIKDIRLGLRWNVVEENKKISLSYYNKYLEYLFENDCNVCLNIGPIKVFRWPEEHIPKHLKTEKEEVITPESEISEYSYEYLDKLLTLLKREYGNKMDNVMFQLDNEGYYKFGRRGITMSNEYILDLVNILKKQFPNNRLMFNSAGRMNLKKLMELFKTIIKKNIYKGTSLVLGYNYYFKLPNTPQKDSLTSLFPLSMSIRRLHKFQKEIGFGLEVSEGQFEPWGKQKTPGNSYMDYEYLLEKCNKYFPKDYIYKLLRLWGTEELALKILNKKVTEEHKKIITSIKDSINQDLKV